MEEGKTGESEGMVVQGRDGAYYGFGPIDRRIERWGWLRLGGGNDSGRRMAGWCVYDSG